MLSVSVFHPNAYWKLGLISLLQELSTNKLVSISISADTTTSDIFIISSTSYLSYTKNSNPHQIIMLVHDVKLADRKNDEYERCSDHIYSDDTKLELIRKIKCAIRHFKKGEVTNRYTAHDLIKTLSDKERVVISELVKGIDARILAAMYNVSVRTISFHKRSAMRKLNARSNKQLLDAIG